MWKTIVYVNLKEEDVEIDSLGSYIYHAGRLCSSVELKNWAGCSHFRQSVSDRFRHLRNSESLLSDTVGRRYDDFRLRRGILNFVGEINKVPWTKIMPTTTKNRFADSRGALMIPLTS